MKIIGVDIGGTGIKAGLFLDNKLVEKISTKTHGKEGLSSILKSLTFAIDYFLKKNFDVNYIGISTAGNIDPKAGKCIYASNNLVGWTGFEIKSFIENHYKITCFVENDAVCHLYSQINKKTFNKNIFLMTIGTGLGAVLYRNNSVLYGKDFDLMKIAHTVVKENGIKCDCGQYGCAEKELSATGLSINARIVYSRRIKVKELFALYAKGDENAKKIIDNYFKEFNWFLNYIKETYHPDLIMIGGGVARSKNVFLKNIVSNCEIQFLRHSGNAGLYGANKLVRRNVNE